MSARLRAVRREAGFTIVELLASMTVLVLLVGAASVVMGAVVHHGGQVQNESLLGTEAQGLIARFSAEFRQTYTGDANVNPIASMSATQLTFYTPDRLTPYHLLEVSYRASGGLLQRQVATSSNTGGPPWTMGSFGSWSTVVGSLTSNSVFTYLDANGNVTATPANVSTVQITLTVANAGQATETSAYSTSVTRRTSG